MRVMKVFDGLRQPGVLAALGAALLFGAGTPLAKLLLIAVNPLMLAGLFYLGSGLGLFLYRRVRRAPPVRLSRAEWPWLLGAIAAGGVLGPVLLLVGLKGMPASGAALLLNAESVFTALLAWFAFKENFDRRIALGMLAIVVGAMVLGWPGEVSFAGIWPPCAVLLACFAWGVDNNLTRKVSLTDATWLASVKGLVAGAVNVSLALALAVGESQVAPAQVAQALILGFFAYGVSLSLFVLGLRQLGTARTGAYFSIAPFFGAGLALVLGEPVTPSLLIAGALMALGLWLHLTEQHVHAHVHGVLEHAHEHVHDEHHQHAHTIAVAPGTRHNHPHRHEPLSHAHAHFPDAHHRHEH